MKGSKSALFLMELIISILFFSLAGTVCIQLFVKSHTLGKETTADSHCLVACQNYAELFVSLMDAESDAECDWDAIAKEISSHSDSKVSEQGVVTKYFDEDWNTCDSENARYKAELHYNGYNKTTGIYEASTRIYDCEDNTLLYSLPVSKHLPYRLGE